MNIVSVQLILIHSRNNWKAFLFYMILVAVNQVWLQFSILSSFFSGIRASVTSVWYSYRILSLEDLNLLASHRLEPSYMFGTFWTYLSKRCLYFGNSLLLCNKDQSYFKIMYWFSYDLLKVKIRLYRERYFKFHIFFYK
jgi:hypothetical protein